MLENIFLTEKVQKRLLSSPYEATEAIATF